MLEGGGGYLWKRNPKPRGTPGRSRTNDATPSPWDRIASERSGARWFWALEKIGPARGGRCEENSFQEISPGPGEPALTVNYKSKCF